MSGTPRHIERLERCLLLAALVVDYDPEALPIFARMERELSAAMARLALTQINDPVARARQRLKIHNDLHGGLA